jgi:hypothetical protein
LETKNHETGSQLLWHGTRDTDPDLIIESDEGFDIKFSHKGYWGRGLYFAKNAGYSDNYAHQRANLKGMFLARVLLGNIEERKEERYKVQ